MAMLTERGQYQLFDDLPADDYAALRADIAKRGVLVPVELDEHGTVLDGHHRVHICEELGISDYPRVVRPGLSESEKRAHVRALNLLRRHLTSEQRRGVIADQLRETPERSDNRIAKTLGVGHPTVARERARLEEAGDVEQRSTRTDSAGRQQPARKPKPLKAATPGILATTPTEERRAVSVAPEASPDGLVTTGAAVREVRREERAAVHEQAAADGGAIMTAIDHDGAIARQRLRSAYMDAMYDLRRNLLPLRAAAVAETLSDGQWRDSSALARDIAAWFAALEAARPRGLRVVGGPDAD